MGKKLFASLIVLVLIVTGLFALLLHNVEATVFSASNYKSILAEQDFYQQAPALVAAAMAPSDDDAGGDTKRGDDPFHGLSAAELEGTLNTVVTKAGFQTIFEDMIDRAFAFLNGEASSISVPLTLIKDNIDKNGMTAVRNIINFKPVCTKSQMANFAKSGIPTCRPPEQSAAKMDGEIGGMLQKLKTDLPDQYAIVSEEVGASQRAQIDVLNQVRMGMAWSWILPVFLLGLIALLFYKTPPTLMRWTGVPLLIVGLLGLAVSKTAGAMGLEIMKEEIAGAGLRAGLGDMVTKIAEASANSVVSPIFMQAAILAVIGLLLIVGAFFVGKSGRSAVPDEPSLAQ